jgi:uncharacterized protein (DUF362 family)
MPIDPAKPRTATVAVLRTRPETVLEDYRRLLALGGVREALPAGTTTILKDNITWHLAFPGVNTTPWQLEGTILGLHDAGITDLVEVHNRTVVTDPVAGERNLKLTPVLEKHRIPVKFNFRDEDMRWVVYEPRAELLALHKIFPEGIRIPDFFLGKSIVHLPTVKTHSYTTYTGALKNAFGGLLNTRRHYTHTWIHETLVDLLAIQQEIHAGLFAVMDGTTAGSGPGPRTVTPHDQHVILASADQVAIDAVAASMMGFDPLSIPCIRLAHERGLGVGDLHDIEIKGDESAAAERWNFEVGVNLATGAGRLLWHSPLQIVQKALFHTPLVNVFVMGSAVFHDHVWYPVFGRPIVDRWKRESPWGRLFDSLPG